MGLYFEQADFRMIGNKVEGGGGNASSITSRSTLHRYRSSIHSNVASIIMEAELVDRSIIGYNISNNCYMNMVIAREVITMRLKKKIGILKE